MNRFFTIAGVFLVGACAQGTVTDGSDGVGANQSIESVAKKVKQEKFMYVGTINSGGSSDPEMVILVGTDPDEPSFGKIISRVDMPAGTVELHHFGYNGDKSALLVPGLFSTNMNVLSLEKPKQPEIVASASLGGSGYVVPHTILSQYDGTALVTMIGSGAFALPGGIIRIDEATGEYIEPFGPGPDRSAGAAGPKYMYDFDTNPHLNRGVSTTFGVPAELAGFVNPAGLGDEIAVWDLAEERVIQTINLGANSGALEARWIQDSPEGYGYVNTPGTSAVWLWEDEDHDGFLSVHQVLGPDNGLAIPVDMLLSEDNQTMFLTNWLSNTVQMYDISDRYQPVLIDEVVVPHPNMLRLSPDGERLYVSNSLLSSWDNDPNFFGPARNDEYGIWLYAVDENGMTSHTADNSSWVDFTAIEKASGVGPAGPHMMLFDPSVETPAGHH